MLNLNSSTVQSDLVRVANFSTISIKTTSQKNLKATCSAPDCALFFDLFSLTQSNNLALGYFSINTHVYTQLLQEVKNDRWSVNWAEHFKHFFLKLSFMETALDASLLEDEASRLHFYWDGLNWFYLYVWDGKTQNFVEVISTENNTVHFRQGQGTLTHLETIARITTTEYPGRPVAKAA
ncbi:MAG: hypothetical protein ACOYME_07575 [Prochlorotrichaceae cyanobacterium]|jgi:hypothetical protein